MSESEVTKLQTGVDWMTITVRSGQARERVYLEFQRLKMMLEDQGHSCSSWSFRGYAGIRIASARWGTRDDSDICMLSGPEACINWLPFSMLAENVTRLDLAVTCTVSPPWENVALDCYQYFENNRDLAPRRVQYTLIKNTNGGQTLYIGSRASDQYARLYDKGKELDPNSEPGLKWRYEIEFKGERAKRVLPQLQRAAGTDDIESAIGSTVYKWFRARDVEPIWSVNGQPMLTDVSTTVTSDEIKLQWLTRQVRPSIANLVKHGKLSEVLDALGLNDNHFIEPTAMWVPRDRRHK